MRLGGPATSCLVGSAGGATFVLLNGNRAGFGYGSAYAASVLLVVDVALAVRLPRGGPGPTLGGRYRWVVVAEVIAVVAGVLALHGRADVAWVTLVVGTHFFFLARVWRTPRLVGVGSALVVLGTAGLVLAGIGASDSAVATVGGVLPGFVLLLSSTGALVLAGEQRDLVG